MNLRSIVAVLTLLAASACSTSSVEEQSATPGRWGEVQLVEDLRIGEYEGADEYLFASITGISQHPDGTVFIIDSSRASTYIRRYDSEGTFLNNVGRMGQGPGEYQRVQAIKPTPDGNLALWDTRLRRVSIMQPDGIFVASFAADSGLSSSKMFQVDPDGNFYVLTWETDPDDSRAARIMSYLKYSEAGVYLETITMPRTGLAIDGRWVLPTNDGFLRPFEHQVVSMITTHGHVVSGHNDDYSLEYSDGGEVLFRVEREWEPIPLHPEERAQWVARQAYISQPIPASVPVNVPLNPKYPPIPETKPAIVGLWPGEDGTVWVQRYTVAHERTDLPARDADDDRPRLTWWQYPTFDVFSPEAEFLGTVTMPHGARIALRHSDYIWTVQPDEHGEDTAVRFRVVKGGGGL